MIDSQASRRAPGRRRPGGPAARSQPPRRRAAARRRRGTYEEPAPHDVAPPSGPTTIRDQLRLDGQGRRRVPRRAGPRDHQEADGAGRDGDAHADAVRRRDRASSPTSSTRRSRSSTRPTRSTPSRVFEDADEDLDRAPAGRHDHGPRRPRQDLAARRDPRDRGGRGRGRRHHPAHRRLPGPPRRQDDHLPRHAGPRGVHRHARPRRPGHRHRRDRGRRRRRREAADARGDRPREGRRGADRRRGQQDRQGGRAARPRPHRDDPARPAARPSGAATPSSSTSRPRRKQGLDDLLETILRRRRARGAQGQPGHRGLRRRRSSPSSTRAAAPVVTVLVQRGTLQRRRRARRRRPLGPRARDARLPRQARRRRPSPASRSRCSASTACPRPASSCASSRTTARRASSPASARNRLKTEALARRSRHARSRSRTIFEQRARATSRSSTSSSRPTCPARSRRSRTRSRSCRRTRSRSTSSTAASAASTSPTSMLAAASDAVVLGFNVRPVGDARAGRRPRGRRDPHLLGHLPRDRGAARRDAGHARARGGRGAVGDVEVRADLPRLADRHDRRLATSPRARSRAARKVRLVRDGTVVYDGEIGVAAPLQRRRRARSPPGFECGIVLDELPGRQGRRRARGLRDAAGRARARLGDRVGRGAASSCSARPPALPGRRLA